MKCDKKGCKNGATERNCITNDCGNYCKKHGRERFNEYWELQSSYNNAKVVPHISFSCVALDRSKK